MLMRCRCYAAYIIAAAAADIFSAPLRHDMSRHALIRLRIFPLFTDFSAGHFAAAISHYYAIFIV